MRFALPVTALARRLDLLLWRLFGQGAWLKSESTALRRTSIITGLLTMLGFSLSK